jgi:hypothetical protein
VSGKQEQNTIKISTISDGRAAGLPEPARRTHPNLNRTPSRYEVTSRRANSVAATAGVVMTAEGRPLAVMAFTVRQGRIAEIDILADPERLRRLDLAVLDG